MIIKNFVGKKGEDVAIEFLKKKGYIILERNYRKKYAEIDIIALRQAPIQSGQAQGKQFNKNEDILVFVEVKTRISKRFGSPFEAITPWKLRPLIKLAEYYQLTHSNLPNLMRIDAIGVEMNETSEVEKIEHLENISGF